MRDLDTEQAPQILLLPENSKLTILRKQIWNKNVDKAQFTDYGFNNWQHRETTVNNGRRLKQSSDQ